MPVEQALFFMNTWFWTSWRTAIHTLYPRSCLSCAALLPSLYRSDLCLECISNIYPLDLGHYHPNPALDHFFGRCRIHHAHALMNFKPGGSVQAMIHKVKYEGQTGLLKKFGSRLGRDLLEMPWAKDIEAVTCVPIHWQRWYLRGYNQGAILGKSIAEELKLPFIVHGLRRKLNTPSQTGLSRIQRVENLKDSISCSKALLKYQHVLIVDDVLTTGATVEACTLAIHDKSNIKVSLACLAIGGM